MLSPKPLWGLDLMTQGVYHRTNIERELSKNNVRSLPPIPRLDRRFRANGSHQFVVPNLLPWRLSNLTLLAKLGYNEAILAHPQAGNSGVGRLNTSFTEAQHRKRLCGAVEKIMEQLSDSDKLELLKYLHEKARQEIDFLRERQDRIFTWSSNVLMALIGALLIVDPSSTPGWSSNTVGKSIASLAVLTFVILSVQWQQRNRIFTGESAQVAQNAERLLHCYDKGYFDPKGEITLYPERWKQSDKKPPSLMKRIFRANYVSATILLGVLAIAMIWLRS